MDIQERFWSKVKIGAPDECWLWTRFVASNGYGMFSVGYAHHNASRIAWILTYGDPGDLKVCHDCPGGDNRLCCNPRHLWLGTARENQKDMAAKGRSCPGEKHGLTSLTNDQVREMRALSTAGWSSSKLGKRFGVAQTTAANIVARRTWKYLT